MFRVLHSNGLQQSLAIGLYLPPSRPGVIVVYAHGAGIKYLEDSVANLDFKPLLLGFDGVKI